MNRWAVFDVDGTLFPPSSLEREFFRFMLMRGTLPFINIFYYLLAGVVMSSHDGWPDGFKSNKLYLKNLPAPEISRQARVYFTRSLKPKFSRVGIDNIHSYRKSHFKILIMSGSPDFMTNNIHHIVQPDTVISAVPEIRNNHFTGRLVGLHPYGPRKTIILKSRQNRLKINFPESAVFANHHSDIEHMKLFGEAFAVNPTPQLKAYAEGKNWPILEW